MEYNDKTLTCRDCGKEFTFTGNEQAFYAEKGFSNEPARCPDCRAKRKATMNGPREMHDITCSNCGKQDQVPFAPKGDRPVLCSDCFKAQRAG
ncbi:MAG TPA: zinc-ribbon domain containing protein [Patescibacteria group bacterium]|nr:zinc-ribbon domain containing protein [Patescibacteria group bacterium]